MPTVADENCATCGHEEREHVAFGVCHAQAGLGGDPDDLCSCMHFSPFARGLDKPIAVELVA